MVHAVHFRVEFLIRRFAIDAVLERAGAQAGRGRGETVAVTKLGLLIGLAQSPDSLGIDIASGIDRVFLLEAGIFLDMGGGPDANLG